MNKLSAILKATLINNYSLNGFSSKISGSKEKKKTLTSALTLLLGAFCITYIVTIYALLMAKPLRQAGFLDLILIMGILASTLIALFTSIYKAQGSLFSAKDYDLLMSFPIKSSTILTSKFIDLMILNWVVTAFAILPVSVIYFIWTSNLSFMYFVYVIISIIFIPLIPTIIASIIAIIISYFSSKFKYTNIITIAGTILVFVALMISSFKAQDLIDYIFKNSNSLMEAMGMIYPPALYLTKALVNNDVIELIKFILISAIPFILFILVFSKLYAKINSMLSEKYSKGNYKIKSLKTNSIKIALVKKELIRYFSTPIYVLNTAIGMIMALIGAIATLFIDGKMLATIMQIPYVDGLFPLIILCMMIFCIGLTNTTNCSISLEGKNLWIMKTMPIKERDIFLGKISVNLIITIPASIIANIIFFVGLKFEIKYLIYNIVISLIFAIFSAILGLIINLIFPKLDFITPTTVVKQSASVMINMLLVLACVALPIAAFILLKISNIDMFIAIVTAILALLTIVLYKILMTISVSKFKKLH